MFLDGNAILTTVFGAGKGAAGHQTHFPQLICAYRGFNAVFAVRGGIIRLDMNESGKGAVAIATALRTPQDFYLFDIK